ncbi:hypothetical protein PQX77_002047 [Marasmius sp. AFHP31]|nr:hypothetical protein PQX77_002047 [Marasmius sp. AFHP31]
MAVLQHSPALVDLRITEADVLEDDLPGPLVKTVTKSFLEKLTVVNREADMLERSIPLPFPSKMKLFKLAVHAHSDADTEFVEMVKSRWYPFHAFSVGPSQSGLRSLRSATLDIQGHKLQ